MAKITVDEAEYQRLVERDLHLSLLEARGVDNWQGYCGLPDRADYATEEEWLRAIDTAEGAW